MGRVIDFAKHRRVCAKQAPIKETTDDTGTILIVRRADGTRSVTLEGLYAEDPPYAIEALAEVIGSLTTTLRQNMNP